ncbi:MAG: hypothetical protein Q7U82_18505 [Gammaproteobacteria bacterium]|nr:hypothetical protein [Gammaproteobacteria bacterium]
MRATTFGALALAVAGLAFAAYEYNAVRDLRVQLQHSDVQLGALRAQLQEQSAANAQLQSTFEGQIASLQQNLQSSSQQLTTLSESLKEAREMLSASITGQPPASGTKP